MKKKSSDLPGDFFVYLYRENSFCLPWKYLPLSTCRGNHATDD